MENIFEKIIAREIPAEIIYEDNDVLSFLDINPINKGHALVIPKQKFVNIFDADTNALSKMMAAVRKVAVAVKEATGADGINIVMNNNAAAGQEVFHAHIHVVPRFEGDGAFKATHDSYDDGEAATVAEKIRNSLT